MSFSSDVLLHHRLDQQALHHDPQYHREVQLLRDALHEVERSLDQTGMSEDERTMILTILVKGVPSATHAHQRIADHRERVREEMARPPRPVFVDIEATDGPSPAT